MPSRRAWRRAFIVCTCASTLLWLSVIALYVNRYYFPRRTTFQQVTPQVAVRLAQHGIWFRAIRDVKQWDWRGTHERWAVTTNVGTFGVSMQTFEPLRANTKRWGVMMISVPYWLMTIGTAFLPFVWLIGVAQKQQRLREALAAPIPPSIS